LLNSRRDRAGYAECLNRLHGDTIELIGGFRDQRSPTIRWPPSLVYRDRSGRILCVRAALETVDPWF
jgi:hypothetical protein